MKKLRELSQSSYILSVLVIESIIVAITKFCINNNKQHKEILSRENKQKVLFLFNDKINYILDEYRQSALQARNIGWTVASLTCHSPCSAVVLLSFVLFYLSSMPGFYLRQTSTSSSTSSHGSCSLLIRSISFRPVHRASTHLASPPGKQILLYRMRCPCTVDTSDKYQGRSVLQLYRGWTWPSFMRWQISTW